MRPFNVIHCIVTKAEMCLCVRLDFSGAWEQFWPDALPVTLTDSYGLHTVALEPRFENPESSNLKTEPRLLLSHGCSLCLTLNQSIIDRLINQSKFFIVA